VSALALDADLLRGRHLHRFDLANAPLTRPAALLITCANWVTASLANYEQVKLDVDVPVPPPGEQVAARSQQVLQPMPPASLVLLNCL